MRPYRQAPNPDRRVLRVVTLNLWGIEPPLQARLALAIDQLRNLAPDVVLLQEVRPSDGIDGPPTSAIIASQLGLHEFTRYYPAPGQPKEGLATLSKYPIAATQWLGLPRVGDTYRMVVSAEVATPHGPIWVHNTHLSHQLDRGEVRERQVVAIDQHIRAIGRTNETPPHILAGDFNATADADELRFLRGLCSLAGGLDVPYRTHFQDAWLRCHPEPVCGDGPAQGITWSSENEHTRPLRSLDIDRRIDYIYVTSRKRDGRGTVLGCEVVLTDRLGAGADSVCASDHYGVMADIQIAAT